MKKIIIVILLWLSVTACTKAPILQTYTIDIIDMKATHAKQYRHKIVKVSYPQSLREEMSHKMNFSYSINDRGTYLNSEWSNEMSKLLQVTLIESLERSKFFKAVLSDTSTLRENYRLESQVFAFEHRVRGDQSHAIVSIQFTLIDADTGGLIKQKKFSYQEPTPSTNAKGYAYATNKAIQRLMVDLMRWLGKRA